MIRKPARRHKVCAFLYEKRRYGLNRTWLNALFCSMMFLFAMVLTVISPLLLEISKTYSLNLAESGWVFTMSFLGFVLFVFFGGIIADVIGKKRLIAISLAGLSLSLLLVIFAETYISFCIMIFFIGGFGGTVEAVMTSAIPEVNEKKAGF
jgi:MFS family permease